MAKHLDPTQPLDAIVLACAKANEKRFTSTFSVTRAAEEALLAGADMVVLVSPPAWGRDGPVAHPIRVPRGVTLADEVEIAAFWLPDYRTADYYADWLREHPPVPRSAA